MDDETRLRIKNAVEAAREQKVYAQSRLRDFERGERIFRGGDGHDMEEVTAKHRTHFEATIDRMDQLISAYEALESA